LGPTRWPQAVADKPHAITVLEDGLRALLVAGRVLTPEALLTPGAIAEPDEDWSQVRCGSMPPRMAVFRHTVIGWMRGAGETNMAAACHRFAARPWSALARLGIRPDN
jgi:hypothetical protein